MIFRHLHKTINYQNLRSGYTQKDNQNCLTLILVMKCINNEHGIIYSKKIQKINYEIILLIQMLSQKQIIFLLTFFTYTIVHMMRTTYSFNKHTFQIIFGINNLFLGILDSIIYLTLALGTFFRYSILNSQKPVEACLYTALPTVIGFSFIPLLSLFKQHKQAVFKQDTSIFVHFLIIISVVAFGFFQLSFFPATLTIFGHHFNVKSEGILVGIWSSKSNVGNILGFLMANLLVYQLHIKWEYTMLICSGLLIIVTVLLYKFVDNPSFENQEVVNTPQFFDFLISTWRKTQFKLYILSFSLFKAILYSYELWTPKFLSQTGYKQFSGYVPMIFDIFTLFGSFFMGHLYQKESNNAQNQGHDQIENFRFLSKYKFFLPACCVTLICVLYVWLPGSLLLYFILGALMGIFLGAIYNSLENNQILTYTNYNPLFIDMFSTINIGIGCLMVGISQFIIGLVLNNSSDDQHHQNQFVQKGQIYIVIAIIGVVASILTYLRTNYIKQERIDLKDQNRQIQLKLISSNMGQK